MMTLRFARLALTLPLLLVTTACEESSDSGGTGGSAGAGGSAAGGTGGSAGSATGGSAGAAGAGGTAGAAGSGGTAGTGGSAGSTGGAGGSAGSGTGGTAGSSGSAGSGTGGSSGSAGGGFLCAGMTASCIITANGYCYETATTTEQNCLGTWAPTDCRTRADYDPPFGCQVPNCSQVIWFPASAAGQESTYTTVCTVTLGGTFIPG